MRMPVAPLRHPYDREILRLAVPAMGALVAEPLFLLADSAIVGHLGTPQLAGLGVAGSALGTVISQWAAASAYVFVVSRAARDLGVGLAPDWRGILTGFRASAPLVVRNLALRGVIALAAGVAARLGSADIAAH